MRQQLDRVQEQFAGNEVPYRDLHGPHRRLVDAVWAAQQGGSPEVGPSDLGSLLWQVLRHETLANGYTVALDVPRDGWVPETRELERHGLTVVEFLDRLRISAPDPWQPDWMSGDASSIDLAISAPHGVRSDGGVVPSWSRPLGAKRVDPAVREVANVSDYRSAAQATALRTVALAPPGSTVHVVLPTGVGKSLVGIVPGLLAGGTTVFVVPTVALALDQERTANERYGAANLPGELAYWGGLDPEVKRLIRERLRRGEQRLLFASPEALVSGLSSALHALARRGGLRFLVLDEAHLVRSWGLDFRPDLQLLAGLRAELLEVAVAHGKPPPTTVLMTATLSEEGLALNDTLFGGTQSQPVTWVASSYLRTELRYLAASCDDDEQRRERLAEALRRLPRPTIVYVTRPAAAESIAAFLRGYGFLRVATFHGGSGGKERIGVLEAWSGAASRTSVDVVIGTSAFGLGVDQSDVRTVIHACVPGSVDRFYQEAGRAGRDGHCAVSLWLSVPRRDLQEARAVESQTVIGDEKAWARWKAMRAGGLSTNELPPGAILLDVSAVPTHVNVASEKNRLWNRNTLTLMARAGLIRVQGAPFPTRQPEEDDESWEARASQEWERFRNSVVCQLDPAIGNLDEGIVVDRLARLRYDILANEDATLLRLEELLFGGRCWADVLAEEYRFDNVRLSGDSVATQHLTPSCSGCPSEGHHGRSDGSAPSPVVPDPPLWHLPLRCQPNLTAQLHSRGAVVVAYSAENLGAHLDELVRKLVRSGIRAVFVPPRLMTHPAVLTAHRWATPEGFVFIEESVRRVHPFPVPSLVVAEDGVRSSWLPPTTTGAERVVVVPEKLPDPEKPSVSIFDYRSPSLRLPEFLRRI